MKLGQIGWLTTGQTLLGVTLLLITSSCSTPSRSEGSASRPAATSHPSPEPESLWSDRFQDANWQNRWDIQDRGAWGQENLEVRPDPTGKFTKVLRVNYPKGSASPSVSRSDGVPLGGAQFYANLGIAPANSLRLSYYVRFSENFSFVKGGNCQDSLAVTGIAAAKFRMVQMASRPASCGDSRGTENFMLIFPLVMNTGLLSVEETGDLNRASGPT